ncbi:hypothetical protein R7Q39_23600 [Vibrio sp. 947]|uniref:Uncharacterized protein n=2 Tax=Vibrio TaxID=662 RepID=A0A5B1BY25_VIBCL|nr:MULTISPECIES: hypothetical protein [Vibrio]EJG0767206.1 hypothetical protein [Vibrio parahaemolyticus O5:K30]AKO77596.1 hypothetical protein EN12_20950 [Vibrio cholerae]EGR2221736.1 hypothetical protein [Vibrio parahaemolyticus]EGR5854863.1 hypothetical protein [Vibrio parahaemolyticus]ELA8198214.1 hypothetical protein [Vibrio parahaemolyticus]
MLKFKKFSDVIGAMLLLLTTILVLGTNMLQTAIKTPESANLVGITFLALFFVSGVKLITKK